VSRTPHRLARGSELSKRLFDLAIAIPALVMLAPLFATIALAIVLTGGRPILFRQERIGRWGQPFTVLKFRTMVVGGDDTAVRAMNSRELKHPGTPAGTSDGVFKIDDDPRVTRLGRPLRRFSLDELPQLWNVIRGEMSIVGPRPSLPWEVELFDESFKRRHDVRPGLTGLWQVSGRNRLSMREMLSLDVEYVDKWSLRKDIRVLLRTPLVVVRGDGAR
jgi:lipopolysaccharide/colanic/teichoic acid biosynthesis glycosyltransferase